MKKLYKYYGFKSCPKGYGITKDKLTIKGKRTWCYKLIKDGETNESTAKTNYEANELTNNETNESTIDEANVSINDKTFDAINDKPLS